jgi:hypothetical protein
MNLGAQFLSQHFESLADLIDNRAEQQFPILQGHSFRCLSVIN